MACIILGKPKEVDVTVKETYAKEIDFLLTAYSATEVEFTLNLTSMEEVLSNLYSSLYTRNDMLIDHNL